MPVDIEPVPMEIFLGPFHPTLEEAFVEEVLLKKKKNPLLPLLLLVPSNSLKRRLKLLLAGEKRLCFLNLSILTFHQLSRHLLEESPGSPSGVIRDELYLEEFLRHLIAEKYQNHDAFSGIIETEGGVSVLRATLRDLKEGLVDPEIALTALREGHFGADSGQFRKLFSLFSLYGEMLGRSEKLGVMDYTDLVQQASGFIASSPFLKTFGHIFYYGFYDLTQVQIDFFYRVADAYPVSLFFPLIEKGPGWVFAGKFFDRYVRGKASEKNPIRSLADRPAAERPFCQIMNCSGIRDEVLTVAKEILRLNEEDKISFQDIGVVARDLPPYLSQVKALFPGHGIPFITTGQEPLVQFPLVKDILLFTRLTEREYHRSRMIDFLSSPYVHIEKLMPKGTEPRPDLWDILTRQIGVSKGAEAWRRLEGYDRNREGDVPPGQARILWAIFNLLDRDFRSLPEKASWPEFSGRWKALLIKYFGLFESPEENQVGREAPVILQVMNILDQLSGLHEFDQEVSLPLFRKTFQRWLERSSHPITEDRMTGVSVMDAMSARGVPFRALFVLGLNEGRFPRTIREDGFLRDGARRVLESVLGYKISEKLSGHDEEKLLFTLLEGSAGEYLYYLYQRSNDSGKSLSPSWYLSEGPEFLGTVRSVPRGTLEKKEVLPFSQPAWMLPGEMAVRLSLQSREASHLFERSPLLKRLIERSGRGLDLIENQGELTGFDGWVGPLPEHWAGLTLQRMAPTALELYAKCPFNYFCRTLLNLRRPEKPEEWTGPPPAETGGLGHEILKNFYQRLTGQDYFSERNREIDIQALLHEVSRDVFLAYESVSAVGYPAAWEVFQEQILETLAEVVAWDLARLRESGYRPDLFETPWEGRLEGEWFKEFEGFPIKGKPDRIDALAGGNRRHIIDYKFKLGKNRKAETKDLYLASVQGKQLQIPLYLLLARQNAVSSGGNGDRPFFEASLYYVAPKWEKGPLVPVHFPENGWEGESGKRVASTIVFLLEGIQGGRFFINPGEACGYCEYRSICREDHRPSLLRLEGNPRVERHRNILEQKNPPSPGEREGT
ncbi:MAG: exodeoxyribonuclease V subunit gamma [Nitrospirae bacterium]|nr:exodeoxyribonuclease V subunit gamma [Nitrospirota bacterium]